MNRPEVRKSGSPEVPPCARRLRLRGRVQGVGMRPFLVRLAETCGVAARIANDNQGVDVTVEGSPTAVATFRSGLATPPPLAHIAGIDEEPASPTGMTGIVIEASRRDGPQDLAITPDGATCADCLREMREPRDRRHGHPFITCVNCGPRYSIITDVPYDRPQTTMAGFPLCAACGLEYADVRDRRHHAQPIACPACGPRLWLADATGRTITDADPIAAAAQLLHDGAIVAVKGLGGFHLACRADSDDALHRLRERKQRDAKPFAIMVTDAAAAERLATIDDDARASLTSSVAPIVLAPLRPGAGLSPLVAPGTDLIGVMLPATPVHHLLCAQVHVPLVMTSGNPGGEPLSSDNDDALARLAGTADAWLMHDRPIARPIDDSVVLATEAGVVPIRRARGFVPDPITLPIICPRPILAVGGDLKAALCFADRDQAVLSEHLGDLENPAAYRHVIAAEERLRRLLRITPQAVACDMHPGYHSVRFARSLGLPLIPVQHHHAHVAACAAEHGVSGPLIGVACDGTGYGGDGTIWGGEILRVDGATMERCAWLMPIQLLGGDAAARDGWRTAASWLHAARIPDWERLAVFAAVDGETLAIARHRLTAGRGAVACSSLGRLFDAMAFLLGLAAHNRHEAEAAMALEQAAHGATGILPLPAPAVERGMLPTADLLAAVLDHQRRGAATADCARAFHDGIADRLALAAIAAARATGETRIALTGGCFLNRILLGRMRHRLIEAGLQPLVHRLVPPGDGGLALGQALVAARTGAPV